VLRGDLPRASAAVFSVPTPRRKVPICLRTSDMRLQASKYEPFAMTVAEAIESGVRFVATSEVGAIGGTWKARSSRR